MPDPFSTPTPADSNSPIRVLLVDDHVLFREGLRNLLASEGIQVAGLAHDGFEALVQARHLHPDVVLMDIQMPRCDGVAATRLIHAEMPECKIVILTISEDEQNRFEAIKSGAPGYLLKRLDARQFFTYLLELQAGHPPFSPGLAEKILKEFSQQSAQGEDWHSQPEEPGAAHESGHQVIGLSARQVQILTPVAQGQTYKQVAEPIGLAERTIKYHMAEILECLHLQNRAQVIAYAARIGLVHHD